MLGSALNEPAQHFFIQDERDTRAQSAGIQANAVIRNWLHRLRYPVINCLIN